MTIVIIPSIPSAREMVLWVVATIILEICAEAVAEDIVGVAAIAIVE